jgi:hypothetical protein
MPARAIGFLAVATNAGLMRPAYGGRRRWNEPAISVFEAGHDAARQVGVDWCVMACID